MTTTHARAIVVAIVIAGVGLVVYLLRPSEERRVRARLDEGAEALSVPASETDLARVARLARLRGFLVEDAVVHFSREGEAPVRGRDAIVGLAARALVPTGARVELHDVRVTIRDAGSVADVMLEAHLVSEDPSAESPTIDARSVSLTWKKTDGSWAVASVRVMESDDSVRQPSP